MTAPLSGGFRTKLLKQVATPASGDAAARRAGPFSGTYGKYLVTGADNTDLLALTGDSSVDANVAPSADNRTPIKKGTAGRVIVHGGDLYVSVKMVGTTSADDDEVIYIEEVDG